MLKQKAEKYFRSAEGYNCAQAIMKAFQEVYSIDKEKMEAHALSGSGRAEGGLCGALFAAKKILGDSDLTNDLEEQFIEKAGSEKCREIRRLKKISCSECVRIAASILQDSMQDK